MAAEALRTNMELIAQGAEGRVYVTPFGLRPRCIVKERFKKSYRHPVLDEKLCKRRTILEARCLLKARRSGIDTPALYLIDSKNSMIYMEFIAGPSLKEFFNKENENDDSRRGMFSETVICTNIGESLAKLHNVDIVHGDLTTSNMMLRTETNSVAFIDFGLGFVSSLAEDKAVDLYVLERALASTHKNSRVLLDAILVGYLNVIKDKKSIVRKLEEGEMAEFGA